MMFTSLTPIRLVLAAAAAGVLAERASAPRRPVSPDARPARTVIASPTDSLGKRIFFDANLSRNRNQACADCHDPAWGWTGPSASLNAAGTVYEGSIPGRFGDRKPPSSAYATISPVLHRDSTGRFVGGNFWDGRATGSKLGNPAADQAQGPFLNPAEQALPDAGCVVYRVSVSGYADLYRSVYGGDIASIRFPAGTDAACAAGTPLSLDSTDRATVNQEFDRIARAIAAFEASGESNRYSSKFDAWRAGRATLTGEEMQGWALFVGKGRCQACHAVTGQTPAFANFAYENLGVPKNPANPVYRSNPGFIDQGLGGYLSTVGGMGGDPAREMGKHRVPTLRNVDLRPSPDSVKAYMHNGVFKSLEQVVHFYNTRDVLPRCEATPSPRFGVNCWPAPEVEQNMNTAQMGNLGLTAAEERALVAFMRTLSDGYVPR